MLENLPSALGHALAEVRAGLDRTVLMSVDLRQGSGRLVLSSLAFADHAPIPQRYTADGDGLSPPLAWHGVPAQAATLVLVVEDADSPTPMPLVHAIAVELPPGDSGALGEGAMGGGQAGKPVVVMGANSLLRDAWLPPDPPPGHGVHRYVFQLFALEAGPVLPAGTGREALCEALVARGLASGALTGTYERPDTTITEPSATLSTPAAAA